jgi:hypothetical protein
MTSMGCKDNRRGDRSDCKPKVLQGWTMQVNWFHKLSTRVTFISLKHNLAVLHFPEEA